MENEKAWRFIHDQLRRDPEYMNFETSPYGRGESTSSDNETIGRKLTRSYGEAPYHCEEPRR